MPMFFSFWPGWISSIAFSVILLANVSQAFASEIDGTIDPNSVGNKYAWSENIGWLNFGTGVGAGDVHITDGGLTGYVWTEQKGWINLAPANSGVTIDGAGNLNGFAWGEQTGYIDFSNASIDANGIFHGTATNVITGTITFDCTNCLVETDYRAVDFRAGGGGGGGGRSHRPEEVPSAAQGSGGTYSSAGGVVPGALPVKNLSVLEALQQLFSWMDSSDAELTQTSMKKKKGLGFFMRHKQTLKLLGLVTGYSNGYDFLKPQEVAITNIAELSKGLMVSFSDCFSILELQRATSHDRGDNPGYWWAGYWSFLNPLLTEFLKEEYQMWDGVEEINIFELLLQFERQYCHF